MPHMDIKLMEIAHILVKCDNNENDDVLDNIKSINEVKKVEKTFGAYNAVIRLEAESISRIKKIMSDIRSRHGILSTLTLVTS